MLRFRDTKTGRWVSIEKAIKEKTRVQKWHIDPQDAKQRYAYGKEKVYRRNPQTVNLQTAVQSVRSGRFVSVHKVRRGDQVRIVNIMGAKQVSQSPGYPVESRRKVKIAIERYHDNLLKQFAPEKPPFIMTPQGMRDEAAARYKESPKKAKTFYLWSQINLACHRKFKDEDFIISAVKDMYTDLKEDMIDTPLNQWTAVIKNYLKDTYE